MFALDPAPPLQALVARFVPGRKVCAFVAAREHGRHPRRLQRLVQPWIDWDAHDAALLLLVTPLPVEPPLGVLPAGVLERIERLRPGALVIDFATPARGLRVRAPSAAVRVAAAAARLSALGRMGLHALDQGEPVGDEDVLVTVGRVRGAAASVSVSGST